MEDRGYYYVIDYRPEEMKPKPRKNKVIKFSKREIKELSIAALVLTLVFAMFFDAMDKIVDKNYSEALLVFFYSFCAVATGFICHEMGHKFTAQKYGLWAEFRYDPNMLLLAVFISLALGVIFAAPGAVMISGYYITREQNGKISVNGPLTNFMVASVSLSFLLLGIGGILGTVLFYVFFINVFLGLFNLLPFGPLDGKKVFRWSREVWGMCLAIGIALITTYYTLV